MMEMLTTIFRWLTITLTMMDSYYDQLAERLYRKAIACDKLEQQYWTGVAGGAGSGKTTTANAIADRLNVHGKSYCVVLPMDGFHYSQAKLAEMDPSGSLMKRRGSPETFDANLCVELLQKAKRDRYGSFPIYDRTISDPVENGVQLLISHRIVLCEGLYLLMKHDPLWAPLDDLWDERWFVKAPSLEIQRHRLIERSLKTWSRSKAETWGEGREGATARVDANDVPNMKRIAQCEKYADIVVVTR
jgi:pantothenate kinase